jgi:hypothetical protein
MVSQFAVAGGVEDEELGLVARQGVVVGAEAVFEGLVIGGELAEGGLGRLAGVGYGGLAIRELEVRMLGMFNPVYRYDAYRGQECGLSSAARTEQENGRELFGSAFAIQEIVEEDGQDYANEEGGQDS